MTWTRDLRRGNIRSPPLPEGGELGQKDERFRGEKVSKSRGGWAQKTYQRGTKTILDPRGGDNFPYFLWGVCVDESV